MHKEFMVLKLAFVRPFSLSSDHPQLFWQLSKGKTDHTSQPLAEFMSTF